MDDDVRNRVLRLISDVLGVDQAALRDDSSPDSIEEWDSLQHMNLVLALEEEFGVRFSDEEIVEIVTVRRVIDAVEAARESA